MAAVGLFTLGTSELGTGILGGLGTGFVDAESTSAGSVNGSIGFSGSATGSVSITGSVAGFVGYVGTASGIVSSSNTVSGFPILFGVVTSDNSTNANVNGSPALSGDSSTVSIIVGSSNGSPSLFGISFGINISSGNVEGSPDVPPTPPTPQPIPDVAGGSAYSPYKLVHWTPKEKPKAPIVIQVDGGVLGTLITSGAIFGISGYVGNAKGLTVNVGSLVGVRYPTDELIAKWKRQQDESELLTIGLL